MFRRLAGITFIATGLLVIAGSSFPHEAAPANALQNECGTCGDDTECSEGEECCATGCEDGLKKCVQENSC